MESLNTALDFIKKHEWVIYGFVTGVFFGKVLFPLAALVSVALIGALVYKNFKN